MNCSRLALLWTLIGALTACAGTPKANIITRDGAGLALAGQPFRFKGINIYNANSRDNCSYNMASGDTLGRSLDAIGAASQNVFRAWFYQFLATNPNGTRDWAPFDHTLAVAAAHHQRVIATLADQWGDCESPPDQPSIYKSQAWYAAGYRETRAPGQSAYRAWAAEVVARYKDDPTILAWQLMNEAEDADERGGACAPSAPSTLQAWATDMSGLVKSLDRRHLLSVGTIGGGQCGSSGPDYVALHAVSDVDLCEYHDYAHIEEPLPGDVLNGLQTRVRQCRALGKPLFVGEIGIETREAGSFEQRAALYDRKLAAQFEAGVAGVLLWAWVDGEHGGSSAGYDIGPSDPALTALRRY